MLVMLPFIHQLSRGDHTSRSLQSYFHQDQNEIKEWTSQFVGLNTLQYIMLLKLPIILSGNS